MTVLFAHRPVLLNEVLDALQPQDGEVYVDCTLGGGGHTEAILERASCQVIGLDRDPAALEASRERLNGFGSRFRAVRTPFSSIQQVLSDLGIHQVNGVLADLGVSSPQLDTAERGFSFSRNGPIDMRMDPDSKLSAADLVNSMPEVDLANVIYAYGEERQSRRIARVIVEGRPWTETTALAAEVARVVGRGSSRIHPATRTFQALRIHVNDELGELERLLPQALDLLAPDGRLLVISFHSLEDRIVKQFMARESGRGVERDAYGNPLVLPRLARPARPVVSSDEETNPRARSARLRTAVRLPWKQ